MVYQAIRDFAARLQTEFQGISSKIEHAGVKGSVRENVVREFLDTFLPSRFAVKSGVIVDSNGTQSKQQDLVVVDSLGMPPFMSGDDSAIVPIESVAVTVEVKSRLTNNELGKAIENTTSVRLLQKRLAGGRADRTRFPAALVFAFATDKPLIELQDHVVKAGTRAPSMITTVKDGSILHFHKHNLHEIALWPTNNTAVGVTEAEETGDTLMTFYLVLMSILQTYSKPQRFPDLLAYAAQAGYVTPARLFRPDQAKGATLDEGKFKVHVDAIRRLQQLYFNEILPQATDKGIPATGLIAILKQWEEALPGFLENNKAMIQYLESLPSDTLKNTYIPMGRMPDDMPYTG